MSFIQWWISLVLGVVVALSGCAAPGAFDEFDEFDEDGAFAGDGYEGADGGVFEDEEGPENESGEDGEVGGSSEALFFATFGGSALSDVREVARGGKANCALTYGGQVYCWGDWNGSRRMPFRPFGSTRMIDVETDGAEYFCAIREAGRVIQCVGRKHSGAAFDSIPHTIPGVVTAMHLSMAGDNRCTVVNNDEVRCWGRYVLGYSNYGYVETPVTVGLPMKGSVIVSVGRYFACAHLGDNFVSCWGMGNPMRPGDARPADVSMNFDRDHLRGITVGRTHACILGVRREYYPERVDVYCWGRSGRGQLGDYNRALRGPTLVHRDRQRGYEGGYETILSAGDDHTCYRDNYRGVVCWGRNDQGQLGNGTTASWLPPVRVTGIGNGATLGAGRFGTCATLTDETVKCWGDNAYGQTTDCGVGNELNPVTVSRSRTCADRLAPLTF